MRNGAWRRVDRAGDQARADGPHAPGLLRTGPRPVGVMHLVPLVFYAAAAAAYLTPLRVARSARRPAGDRHPRRRRARAHVPHRHADGARRPRAARRHDRGALGVRLAARPVVSLHRADDRRARDGRLRRAADRRARPDSGARPDGQPASAAPAEPALHPAHRLDALRLRQLRARLRARRHLRAALQGDQGEASRLLLCPPAVAAGARRA